MEALSISLFMLKKSKKCEFYFNPCSFFEPFYEKGQYLLSRSSKGASPLNRAPIGFYAKVHVFKAQFEGEAAIF